MNTFESALAAVDDFEWGVKSKPAVLPEKTTKESSSSEDDEQGDNVKRKKRGKKRKEKKLNDIIVEDHVSKVTTFDAVSGNYMDLETIDECERLVLAFPNSSKAWLLYMVFHLKQAEIEKARNVANRALKTICFREEKEKCNIWVAYLNLENLYGTHQSLMDVFKESLCYNEPKNMYNHLADLYLKFEKNEDAEELLKTMVKKFKQDKDVWIKLITFFMKTGRSVEARKLMDQSLKSLHEKTHADMKASLAFLEYEYGEIGRGKTMLENVINTYPKRRDILARYTQLLSKSGNSEDVFRLSCT